MSDRPLSVQIAAEIRKQLFLRDMTATQLGQQAGMTQPYISRRLTGATAFDVDDLQRIAEALDVQVADLLPQHTRTTSDRPGRRLTGSSPQPADRPRSTSAILSRSAHVRREPQPEDDHDIPLATGGYRDTTADIGLERRPVRLCGGSTR